MHPFPVTHAQIPVFFEEKSETDAGSKDNFS
jgi:hypothetical protein